MPSTAAAIPGPKPSRFQRLIYRPGPDPLGFFTNLARTYGDVVAFQMGGEQVVMLNAPQHVRDVLVTNSRFFMKGRGLQRSKRLLGEGLLTSEDPLHLRQRRLMQPAFHRERIAAYGETMVAYADRLRQGWRDGQTVDVAQEMMRVTLSIAGKTLFDVDVESQAADVGRALTAVMESFWLTMLPFAEVLERLPVPQLRRAKAARARLDAMIYKMIADRRAAADGRAIADRGDLLSMLLLAQDPPSPDQGEEDVASTGLRPASDRGAMTDRQVRDEAMTIFLAGHETTANALTWTWYLLNTAPEAESKLHEEVDRVLQGRLPTVGDIGALPYVERVVTEAMRLYPPAWLIGRRALKDYTINDPSGDYLAPARTIIVTSPYVMQRDARFFPDPERFDPDRWTPEFRAALPPFAYFPFGGGPRRCIGESFAWMELVLVAAAIAQQWTLRLVPGHPVEPQPVVTLRTKHGMRMTLHRRAEAR
jgi:cytochrome P450